MPAARHLRTSQNIHDGAETHRVDAALCRAGVAFVANPAAPYTTSRRSVLPSLRLQTTESRSIVTVWRSHAKALERIVIHVGLVRSARRQFVTPFVSVLSQPSQVATPCLDIGSAAGRM